MTRNQRAFSLVEVIIAVGVVAFLVVSLVGLIVPIQEGLREDNLTASASRFLGVVEEKLKSADELLIAEIERGSALLVVYQVRVKADFAFQSEPTQGDLHPTVSGGIGKGYRLAPVVRRAWTAEETMAWQDDADAIDGPAFLVHIREENEGRLQPGQLSMQEDSEVRIVNCYWYALPIGFEREQWDGLVDRRPLLKTPLVHRP